MALVAGVDSSTQSVKILVCDSESGAIIKSAHAAHPNGTEVDPNNWWLALNSVISEIGGLENIAAISISGQQHGLILLDANGEVIRPALLWNDVRSASQATTINQNFPDIAQRTGSLLVPSFTASKLRWVTENEKTSADRIAAICLPHDWLSWKLSGSTDIHDIFTDRSDASGTGYFNSQTNTYDREIIEFCLGRGASDVYLPRIVHKNSIAAKNGSTLIAAGSGDNAGAAFGLQIKAGEIIVSLGTSGTAFSVSAKSSHDASGAVAGFADMSGNYLPLVCTLNAARILDAATEILMVSHDRLGDLAMQSKPGANGLTLIPYFEGERTPNLPNATGMLSGLSLKNSNPSDIARAFIEGSLCGLVDAVTRLDIDNTKPKKIMLTGGAAQNHAVQEIAATLFGCEILIPPIREYVAFGAARQAAWLLNDQNELPNWNIGDIKSVSDIYHPEVFENYLLTRNKTYGNS